VARQCLEGSNSERNFPPSAPMGGKKMNYKNKEKIHIIRKMNFLKNNPWIIKMWEEQGKILSDYYEKQDRIEKKFKKIANKNGIKEIWFATVNGETFGIDVNNVRLFGEKKDRFLIHDSDIMKFSEKLKVKK